MLTTQELINLIKAIDIRRGHNWKQYRDEYDRFMRGEDLANDLNRLIKTNKKSELTVDNNPITPTINLTINPTTETPVKYIINRRKKEGKK